MERKFPHDDHTYLNIIRRNGDHLLKTVLDFLDYSRIESGQLDMNLETGSLKAAAAEAILSQTPGAQAKSLQIALHAPEDVVMTFDRKRIHQVMTNLISNAVRFSPEGGTVEVSVKQADGNWAEVCVADQGPGIDMKYHSAIFEKFYQIADERNHALHKGSSGIGLAICKGLVQAHGGRIWVESTPAVGSRFHFTVPIHG